MITEFIRGHGIFKRIVVSASLLSLSACAATPGRWARPVLPADNPVPTIETDNHGVEAVTSFGGFREDENPEARDFNGDMTPDAFVKAQQLAFSSNHAKNQRQFFDYVERTHAQSAKLAECFDRHDCGVWVDLLADATDLTRKIEDPLAKIMFLNGVVNYAMRYDKTHEFDTTLTALEVFSAPDPGGVCKEYAGVKSQLMRDVIVDPRNIRIILGTIYESATSKRDDGHVVLLVHQDGRNWILSNQTREGPPTDDAIDYLTLIESPMRALNGNGLSSRIKGMLGFAFLPRWAGNLGDKKVRPYAGTNFNLPPIPVSSAAIDPIESAPFTKRMLAMPEEVQRAIREIFERIYSLRHDPLKRRPIHPSSTARLRPTQTSEPHGSQGLTQN